MQREHLTKEEATEFFSELYGGEHHIPGRKVKEYGFGFYVLNYSDMATFDYTTLTKFVLMCHDKCYRGSIAPHNFKEIKVCIWKRQGREGGMSERHPDILQAINFYYPSLLTPTK